MLGKYRMDALARIIVGTIWFVVATLALAFVWLPFAVALKLIDVVWQLLVNTEGPVPDSTIEEPFTWWSMNVSWWLFGDGSFRPLPYA
ncbi:hypothetical protein C2R22_24510 (plasmid) [Salinigranum rubrum]|uniref:Uncharacterized protein n=1 Tax=Salinigranum rubrum TaxID=755307 RepID=A0A2I8VS55_9EURY|nr:hypothetical protein [Salinigranum rubrum]AUV84694.1 hypothetical protein C2R22_24510 [Salinigranum rubrum]